MNDEYVSKPVKVRAMQWVEQIDGSGGALSAETIVNWINDNGGEARYEPYTSEKNHGVVVAYTPARIAVLTVNGWAYAAPGHYIVMGEAWFRPRGMTWAHDDPGECRDFYPCDPETFDRRWELAGSGGGQ